MLHLLIDTSVWLDLAERRDGQRWIVPLRVLLFQKKLKLMVPALVIDGTLRRCRSARSRRGSGPR